MKKYHILSIIAIMAILAACKEEPIGLQPMDSVPPSPISNPRWDSIPGGVVFRFDMPADEDLLYVKAIYTNEKGETAEAKASIFSDSLRIEGFNMPKSRKATLYAVDRSSNASEGVDVTFTNGVPTVYYVGQSLYAVADFGGIHAYWKNPTRKEISVVIAYKDNNDEYVPLDTYYSTAADGEALYIGLDTLPIDVAVFAQDRWENRTTDKVYEGVVPIYETQLSPTNFRPYMLPGDGPLYASSGAWGEVQSIWNGQKADDSGVSTAGGKGVWPQSITIDLGQIVKLSRIRLFQRMGTYTWSEGNLRLFEIWGMADTPPADGSWNSWTLLMDCVSVKPSGLPGQENTDEDIARARDGEDFFNSPLNPKVRYLRIKVKRTWAGGDNFQINEMFFYGDPR